MRQYAGRRLKTALLRGLAASAFIAISGTGLAYQAWENDNTYPPPGLMRDPVGT